MELDPDHLCAYKPAQKKLKSTAGASPVVAEGGDASSPKKSAHSRA